MIVPEPRTTAGRYRHRAEELRAIADGMLSIECAQILRALAKDYEEWAERHEAAELLAPANSGRRAG